MTNKYIIHVCTLQNNAYYSSESVLLTSCCAVPGGSQVVPIQEIINCTLDLITILGQFCGWNGVVAVCSIELAVMKVNKSSAKVSTVHQFLLTL